jgi:hypothetical protein
MRCRGVSCPFVAAASNSMTGELLQRESDLQSDLITLNLAILDRSAHLPDFEPAEIPQCLVDRIVDRLEMLCSDVPTTSTTL